jgi:hypothetical protein
MSGLSVVTKQGHDLRATIWSEQVATTQHQLAHNVERKEDGSVIATAPSLVERTEGLIIVIHGRGLTSYISRATRLSDLGISQV